MLRRRSLIELMFECRWCLLRWLVSNMSSPGGGKMATTMRWETARQALARAEASTGVRTRLPALPSTPALSSASATPSTPALPSAPAISNTDHLPVPAAMLDLFPDGGPARGRVLRVGGALPVRV